MRVVTESKRPDRVEDIFVLALGSDATDPRSAAERFVGADGVLVDFGNFRVDSRQSAAILYSRAVGSPESNPLMDGLSEARQIPSAKVVDDAPMPTDRFFELVAISGPNPLLRGSTAVARDVAQIISPNDVASFWSRKEELVSRLAKVPVELHPGTDSFLCWALAVIFGPRERLDSVLRGEVPVVPESDMEAAEGFTSLAEDIQYLQGGEHISFISSSWLAEFGDPLDSSSRGESIPSLHGFYFRSVAASGIGVECAGLLADEYSPGRGILEERINQLAAGYGVHAPSEIVTAPTGTNFGFTGLEFLSLTPPWKGSVAGYLAGTGLGTA